MREGTDKYDDSKDGGYSYGEKLKMAAEGMLDPQEIGLPKDDAGIKAAQNELKPPTVMKLGDFVTFEASVVPPQLRAHWAWQDLAVKPSEHMKAWEAEWCADHKNEHAIQGLLHSGALAAKVGQLFTDPILGFVDLMRKAADILEQKYKELKENDPNPIITRDEAAQEEAKRITGA
jgi:hypothetical protein